MPPSEPSPIRLSAARTAAWALLLGAWVGLGVLGRIHAPDLAAGLMPLVLWLLVTGLMLAWGRRRSGLPLSSMRLRAGLGLSAGAAALGLLGLEHHLSGLARLPMLVLVALGWAGLVVHASWVVRTLREQAQARSPTMQSLQPPYGPALLAALLVSGLCGFIVTANGSALALALALRTASPTGIGPWLALVFGAAGLLSLLTPRAALEKSCAAGLFDCALPLQGLAGPVQARDLPLHISRHAMMPMMATLAWMSDWCASAQVPWAATIAIHLLAMLAPPWLLHRALRTLPGASMQAVVSALAPLFVSLLMAASLWPLLASTDETAGTNGLTVAALLQSMAWGVAWWDRPAQRHRVANLARSTHLACRITALALPSASLLLVGLALQAEGPSALWGLLMALGVAGSLSSLTYRSSACVDCASAGTEHKKPDPAPPMHARSIAQ